MEIIIRLLDICNTLLEMLVLYACAGIICKKNMQTGWHRCIPYLGTSAVIYLITWIIPMDTTKIIPEMIVWCLLMKAFTKDRWRNLITAFCLSFYIVAAVSFFGLTVSQLLFRQNSIVVGGQPLLIWQIYALAILANIFVACLLLKYRTDFQYEIQIKDMVMIGSVTLIFYAVCFSIGSGFWAGNNKWYNTAAVTAALLFCLCFLLLMLFYKNNACLKEQNFVANQQLREARMQYQYYLEKEKQEEKIRRIYHDMKNHLLLLEHEPKSAESRQLTEKLLNEIAGYENDIRSGNQFLDIILNDKARKAKENQVDFSAFLDFSEITFIEPLDISTIFGNGIDNALEASAALPPEKRVVILKGGKKENFVLLLIENHFMENEIMTTRRTAKEDTFLHGLGLSNIKKAVRKYDGEYRITKKNGCFSLTIIIPFPETV